MTSPKTEIRSPRGGRLGIAALGVAAVVVGVVRWRVTGRLLDPWVLGAAGFALILGYLVAYISILRVVADESGLHITTLARRRSLPWNEVADLRIREQVNKGHVVRRVEAVREDGRTVRLPLPMTADDKPDFDKQVRTLRALLRHHRPDGGVPDRPATINGRTVGDRRWVALSFGVFLLALAGVTAWNVPGEADKARGWRSVAACTEAIPENRFRDCLFTEPATIDSIVLDCGSGRGADHSRLYFVRGEPLRRVEVGCDAASAFRRGDRVGVTFWRGDVVRVSGERHTWRERPPQPAATAMIAAGLFLAGCYPAARVVVRLRHLRRPVDEVLPATEPFLLPILGTAAWLLPLAFLRPTGVFTSPVAAAGAVVSLALLWWAWRATAIRDPGAAIASNAPVPGASTAPVPGEDVFVRANFLDDTAYSPAGFGSRHIVVGGGPMAVVLDKASGRFLAKPVPVERLTVLRVRRVVGGDGDGVPSGWHVAELDDAGTPVRLAAAPSDLRFLLQQLGQAPPAE